MPRYLKQISIILLSAAAYWACARLGLALSFENSNATLIWIPSGLAVALTVLWGNSILPGIFIGAFLANWQVFNLNQTAESWQMVSMSFLIGLGNTGEAFVGSALMKRTLLRKSGPLDHRDVFYYAALMLLAVMVSAVMGVGTLWSNELITLENAAKVFRIWFFGDYSGVVLVAPLLVLFANKKQVSRSFKSPEFVLNAIMVTGITAYVFFTDNWTGQPVKAYLILPFLMWAAFRFNLLEMSFLLFTTVILVILGTIDGHGPFSTTDLQSGLLELQMFNVVLAVSFYALSAVINQNHYIRKKLESNNENLENRILERTRALNDKVDEIDKASKELEYLRSEFKVACDIASLGHFQWDVLNNHLYWSEQLYQIFEVDPKTFKASFEGYFERIHPHDRDRLSHVLQMAFKNHQPYEIENRIVTPSGEVKWLSARGRVTVNQNDEVVMFRGTAMDITALKAKESLSAHLISIIEHSDDAIISVATDGNIVNWNAAAERLYEVPKGAVEGMLIYDLVEDPTHREALKEKLQKVFQGQVITADDVDIKIHNRGNRSFWVTYTPIYDFEHQVTGASIFLRDITSRKAQEDNRFKMIVDSVPNLIFLINDKGRIELINRHAQQVLGFNEKELLRQRFDLLLDSPFSSAESHGSNLYQILQKRLKEAGQERFIRHKYGNRVPVECQISPIETNDGQKLLVAMVDITERLRLERERQQQKVMQETLRVKDQFMANMSHEIRTPMNAIIGFTDLLDKSGLSDTQLEYVEAIKSSGKNLLTIVNDILDLSKIHNGKIVFERSPVSVEDVCKNIAVIFEPKAKAKGLKLNTLLDPNDRIVVWGDQVRLSQILINLLGNALKFTEQGGVSFGYRVVSKTNEEVTLEFVVEDTGIGIETNLLDRVFDRFTQANTETNRLYGGTGLGLSIVKGLIEALNGSIQVSSEKGKGTRFSFKLTFEKYPEDGHASMDHSEPESQQPKDYHIAGKRILLVEDNKLNQRLALTLLKQAGCLVELAENGEEAVAWLKKARFDLVLMDMQMPIMDGYTAVGVIRNDLKMDVPIIAMTAHAMAGERDKCIGLGMNEYVSKPFTKDDLFQKMERLVA
ncbi:MAG TPA: PAS domain S-box protein [Luteibaculaceae bacterium]|nr:PAS domain S-box protein [Luteibaculaceae bacterium]